MCERGGRAPSDDGVMGRKACGLERNGGGNNEAGVRSWHVVNGPTVLRRSDLDGSLRTAGGEMIIIANGLVGGSCT